MLCFPTALTSGFTHLPTISFRITVRIITINHVVSIGIAILGGFLWEVMGIEVLFSMAAAFGLGSFLFSLTLPAAGRRNASLAGANRLESDGS